jgi:hypothetical protein
MALSKIQAESMNLADTYAFSGTVSGVGAIGQGQTTTTPTRALNTVYTNTTGRSIEVHVSFYYSGGAIQFGVEIDGINTILQSGDHGAWASAQFIVRNGGTYKIPTNTHTAKVWYELST